MKTELHELWEQRDALLAKQIRGEFTAEDREAVIPLMDKIYAQQRDLVQDLREAFGDRVKDDIVAVEIYRALCNIAWRNDDGSRYEGTWRYAGGVVADLRDQGEDYLTFYCSGGEGVVSPEIEKSLAARGWRWKEM